VLNNGRPLPLGGNRQRALLALLLLNPNEVVSTDRLLDELWGEQPPESRSKAAKGPAGRRRPGDKTAGLRAPCR
jgi:DNA-binding SARP family transcriptional activator